MVSLELIFSSSGFPGRKEALVEGIGKSAVERKANQNKTKQNKTKQNKTKQNIFLAEIDKVASERAQGKGGCE